MNITRRLACALLLTGLPLSAASAADIWLYSDRDFTGAFSQTSRSESSLGPGGARSVRVSTGIWELCTQRAYRGNCQRVGPGDYRTVGDRNSQYTIHSARLVSATGQPDRPQSRYDSSGGQIQLFQAPDFAGRSQSYSRDSNNLSFGPASAIVQSGVWELCTGRNYDQRCQALTPGQYRDLGPQIGYRTQSLRLVSRTQSQPQSYAQSQPYTQRQQDGYLPPSATLPAGQHSLVLFSDANLRGEVRNVDGAVSDLRDLNFNDRTRSLRIFSGHWELCADSNHRPPCVVLGAGDHNVDYPLDRAVSSIRPISAAAASRYSQPAPSGPAPTGYDVVLYTDSDFRGQNIGISSNVRNLSDHRFNDRTSSIIVNSGTWQFCVDADYRGECYELRPGRYRDVPPGTNDKLTSLRRVR